MLGLAVPALLAGLFNGIYLCYAFSNDNIPSIPAFESDIPGASSLLYVYAILFLPTLFSLLVGLNILVWSRSRINYAFIFGEWIPSNASTGFDSGIYRLGRQNSARQPAILRGESCLTSARFPFDLIYSSSRHQPFSLQLSYTLSGYRSRASSEIRLIPHGGRLSGSPLQPPYCATHSRCCSNHRGGGLLRKAESSWRQVLTPLRYA